MYIHVTQNDIDNGIASAAHECPIARAVERTTGIPGYATFDTERKGDHIIKRAVIGVSFGEFAHKEYRVSDKVMKLMLKIDNGRSVQPFRFKMPDQMRRDLGL